MVAEKLGSLILWFLGCLVAASILGLVAASGVIVFTRALNAAGLTVAIPVRIVNIDKR